MKSISKSLLVVLIVLVVTLTATEVIDLSDSTHTVTLEFGLTPTDSGNTYKVQLNHSRTAWADGEKFYALWAIIDQGTEVTSDESTNGVSIDVLWDNTVCSVDGDWNGFYFDVPLVNTSGVFTPGTARNLQARDLAYSPNNVTYVNSSPLQIDFDVQEPDPAGKAIVCLHNNLYTGSVTRSSETDGFEVAYLNFDDGSSDVGGEESSAYRTGTLAVLAMAALAFLI